MTRSFRTWLIALAFASTGMLAACGEPADDGGTPPAPAMQDQGGTGGTAPAPAPAPQ